MSFAKLGLQPPLTQTLAELGYAAPTAVQQQAVPAVLAGRDVLAAAQTGTGKTAAFVLPLLQMLAATPAAGPAPRAVVLVPTRELAEQVLASCQRYGAGLPLRCYALYGGVSHGPQLTALREGVDLLVATPGRLIDLFGKGELRLREVRHVVLDEADRMLDLGFADDLATVFQALPRERQVLLFSATFADAVRALARARLRKPLSIEATPRNTAARTIRQWVVPVDKKRKPELFLFMWRDRGWQQVLVFVKTKLGADELAERLRGKGIAAEAIHGDRPQASRQAALAAFKAGTVAVLVATDVAARGLDIDGLPQVVNFDLPLQAEDYVHRIGRTGRAGAAGEAISFVCADEAPQLAAIESLLKKKLSRDEEPGFEPRHQLPATVAAVAAPSRRPPPLAKAGAGRGRTPGNWVGFDERPGGARRGRPGGAKSGRGGR
ncbi:superfamily II DNA/RNA helicase [Azonexus fungiphilus]|uniref:Superfamily II DNA/RNA helicase n=1 Tax=Azonexus fungiphilus TaxID=146940 RepID=A0A495VTS1_9RHOO|nr:DEAD/DEAH box helicase [Azonexus fungiphilus]RKT51078.1 superfamily II DNA/RNA helicase [Azonexus fungiphilus]